MGTWPLGTFSSLSSRPGDPPAPLFLLFHTMALDRSRCCICCRLLSDDRRYRRSRRRRRRARRSPQLTARAVSGSAVGWVASSLLGLDRWWSSAAGKQASSCGNL
jgi:hypothetical protein